MTKNRKIAALALLSLVAFAAVMGGVLLTAQAADTATATDENTLNTTTNTVVGDCGDALCLGFGGMGFRGRHRGGPMAMFGGFGAIEVSEEFEQKVTGIATNDTDVQNLLADGYNVTAVRPIIKTVIDADGYVTTKATSAIVILQKGTSDTSNASGYASVSVDIENAKVTEIVILTRTVIDKS